MILYKAGVQCKEAEILMEKDGSPRLLSYLNDKKQLQNRFDKGLKTFVDSGAFSAHTKGVKIDVDDYIQYVNDHDAYITIFAQLDTIPGRFKEVKTVEQLKQAPELSWENYLYMRKRVVSPAKLLPIFHQGEDFCHLKRMLEYLPKIDYMGISPANDLITEKKITWLEIVFDIIKNSSNSNIKTHAFGLTSLRLLDRFDFYSCDSTVWVMASMNGEILTKYGRLFVSDKGTNKSNNVIYNNYLSLKNINEYVESRGYTLDKLASDYKARACFNISFLTDWANSHNYVNNKSKQNKLF